MNKTLLVILSLSIALFINVESKAQTTLQTVDFETAGSGYTITGAQTTSGDDWFERTDGTTVLPDVAFTGKQGTYYIYAEDTDNGRTTDDPVYVTLNAIDVSLYTNLSVKLLVAANNSVDAGKEKTEYLKIQYSFDGGAFVTRTQFIAPSVAATYYAEDTNVDGTTDGASLSTAFTEFTYSIPSSGTNLQMRILVNVNTGREEMGFDNIRVIAGGILPVELTSFIALTIDNNIQLNWKTATEVNNYGFEVERTIKNEKLEIINWETIGFVAGAGNSNSPKEYSFTDKPKDGTEFKYRLKQIDNDGQYEYSPEVEVSLNAVSDYSLKQNFPNPFNPTTKIEYSIPTDNNVEIKVFNVLGVEVATLLNEQRQAGTHSIEFNSDALPSGIYFYKINSGKYSEVKKMILLR